MTESAENPDHARVIPFSMGSGELCYMCNLPITPEQLALYDDIGSRHICGSGCSQAVAAYLRQKAE